MKVTSILLILLGLSTHILVAQSNVKVTNIKAELNRLDRKIYIYYDLSAKGSRYDKYEVEVFLSEDGGETFPYRLDYVQGSVGKGIQAGYGKVIEWRYLQDRPAFTGQNIAFEIKAKLDLLDKERRIERLGGPGKAMLSLLYPGLGSYKVREGNQKWYYGVGILAYGMVGTGLYLRFQSDANYDDYQAGSTVLDVNQLNNLADERSRLLDRAQDQRRFSDILLIGGGAIWLTEFTFALLKGIKNRNEKYRIMAQKTISFTPFFEPWGRQPRLGLRFKL